MDLNRGAADDPILQGIFELLTRMVQRAVADSKGEGMAKTDGLDPILLQKEAQSFLAWLRREDGEIDEIFSSVQSEMFDVAATASQSWRSAGNDGSSRGASRSRGRENGSDREKSGGSKKMSVREEVRERDRAELAAIRAAKQAELTARQEHIQATAPAALDTVDKLVYSHAPQNATMIDSLVGMLEKSPTQIVSESREAAQAKPERKEVKERKGETEAQKLHRLMAAAVEVKTKDLSRSPGVFVKEAASFEQLRQNFRTAVLKTKSLSDTEKQTAVSQLIADYEKRAFNATWRMDGLQRRQISADVRDAKLAVGLDW